MFHEIIAGDVNKVKRLLIEGVGINTTDKVEKTLLHQALEHNSVDVARLLI
jgi:ankyrin repeat protein